MRKRKAQHDAPAPGIGSRIVSAHREHWGWAVGVWSAAGFVGAVWLSGFSAANVVVTKSEVLALHEAQEKKIILAKETNLYLLEARIARIYGELGVLREKLRQRRADQSDIARIRQLEAELAAAEAAKKGLIK